MMATPSPSSVSLCVLRGQKLRTTFSAVGTLSVCLLLSACLLLTSCSSVLSNRGPGQKFYVLSTKRVCDQSPVKKPVKLLLHDTDGSAFLANQRIIFGPDPITRASYQFAYWTEPPTKRLARVIEESLRCSSFASEVSTEAGLIDSDFTVSTRLEEFFHDASTSPGQGVVTLRAELYNERTRTIVATTVFNATAPAPSYDAVGAVTALSAASEQVVSDLMRWLRERT